MENRRKLFKKFDILIISFLLLLGGAVFSWQSFLQQSNDDTLYAHIALDGQEVLVLDLSTDGFFVLEQLPNVHFQISGGAAAFVVSDCPDQICVRRGFLSRPGDSAICLPNMASLLIRSAANDDVDIIAH